MNTSNTMATGDGDSIKPKASVPDESDIGTGKIINADDNILMAQGHAPVLQRTFDLLGSLGLGFRSVVYG
jgi:choline transport protein